MKNILIPKIEEGSTGGVPPDGYEYWHILEGSNKKEKGMAVVYDWFDRNTKKIVELEKKIDEYEKKSKKQSAQSIEIIGIFSAILALLIMDVNIIKSAPTFLSAVLLVSALTTSLIIFISIIHYYFSGGEDNNLGKGFWCGIIILLIFIVLGVITDIFNVDLYKIGLENVEVPSISALEKESSTQKSVK